MMRFQAVYGLLFLASLAATVILTTTILSNNCGINLNGQLLLPYHLHHQFFHLQTQISSLLLQLHDNKNNPTNDTSAMYADKLLKIALYLDKITDQLTNLPQSNNSPCDAFETTVYFNESSNNDDDHAELSGSRFVLNSPEALSYSAPKPHRHGNKNFLGVDAINPSIGIMCAAMATDFNRFLEYKAYRKCPDDWDLAQKLMMAGCDPLPRRRCFAKAPPNYGKPFPYDTSLWSPPSDTNTLWSHYKCKSFSCLLSERKGFTKCSTCFNLTTRDWMNSSSETEFTIDQVLALKPGEIRIGLDFSTTAGSFAALMKERNVTIASATMNLGAPFSEVIALRGLLPIYLSVGSRLPFFDNTLDIIHSTMFLDGWISLDLLEYILFDWDRVLRPKGILWIDRFFCSKDEMKIYLDVFAKLAYKTLLWNVVPKTDKSGDEQFFSAVLEKPLNS